MCVCVCVCVCVKKFLLPAVECVVLLFQSKFSLLDLNHLPGQILWFPTFRQTEQLLYTCEQMHTHSKTHTMKNLYKREQKGQRIDGNDRFSIFLC